MCFYFIFPKHWAGAIFEMLPKVHFVSSSLDVTTDVYVWIYLMMPFKALMLNYNFMDWCTVEIVKWHYRGTSNKRSKFASCIFFNVWV